MAKKSKPTLPFRWNAREYEYFPKSADWFWTISVLTIAIFAAAIILGNFLLGVLALVSGIAIILHGVRKPRNVTFSITVRGVQIGDKLYPYDNLESFWIYYDPPRKKELSLKSQKMFMPYVQIPLGDADPNIIREFLLKFIKEKEHEESFTDAIMKIMRF